jgi:threonine/homoserine/homoserine lactone efflux protein
MAEAIGQVLPLAVGVALSPVPIIAVVLMLGTPRARANGPAFVLGWVIGLALAGTVILLASSGANASDEGEPADWVGVLKLVLGVLLLLVAARTWQVRPRGDREAELPKWMQTIDEFTASRSIGLGALLSGVNPKNLVLTVGAAAAIAQTGIPAGEQAVALAVFIIVATLGPGIPVAIYLARGDRAERPLEDLKGWMAAHNAAIMAVLCLLIATKLIGDGITALA